MRVLKEVSGATARGSGRPTDPPAATEVPLSSMNLETQLQGGGGVGGTHCRLLPDSWWEGGPGSAARSPAAFPVRVACVAGCCAGRLIRAIVSSDPHTAGVCVISSSPQELGGFMGGTAVDCCQGRNEV